MIEWWNNRSLKISLHCMYLNRLMGSIVRLWSVSASAEFSRIFFNRPPRCIQQSMAARSRCTRNTVQNRAIDPRIRYSVTRFFRTQVFSHHSIPHKEEKKSDEKLLDKSNTDWKNQWTLQNWKKISWHCHFKRPFRGT